jgi:hypothetical protein
VKPRRGSRHARSNEWSADEAGDAATTAARERVREVLEGVTRINLGVVVVAPPDATRMAARDVARTAASVAGRGPLLREAQTAAREVVLESFARSGFSGTWALTEMSMSVAGPTDRMAAAAAFEEAAMAAVVEDLVDPETLAFLRSTSDELASLTAIPTPGSIAEFGRPGSTIHGVVPLALVGGLAILLVFAGLGGASLVTLVLGLVMVAGLAQRRRRSER